MKDRRLYAPFDIGMDENPKIIGLSDAAFRAMFESVLYSRRALSDGFLDERVVLRKWGAGVAAELESNDPEHPSWVRVEGGWQIHDFAEHNPLRAEIEAKRADVSAKRSQAGRKGAAKRWQTDSKAVTSDSSETETKTEENTLSNVADATVRRGDEKPVELSLLAPQPKSAYTAEFETWWAHYPRRESKGDAFKAWQQLRRSKTAPPVDVLIAAAESYARSEQRPQFRKLPAGWLRARKWEDEQPRNGLPDGYRPEDGYSLRGGKLFRRGMPVVGGKHGMTPAEANAWRARMAEAAHA